MICTFFGHRDTPDSVEPVLRETIAALIENEEANTFYVGNQGKFDYMVIRVLKKLKAVYENIECVVVLAYMPREGVMDERLNGVKTTYPEGLESTPARYAINKRNRWMVNKSDIVITYVKNPTGGAAFFKELAEKKGKRVINTATMPQ